MTKFRTPNYHTKPFKMDKNFFQSGQIHPGGQNHPGLRYGHFKPLTRFVNSFWRSQWLFTFNFRQFNSKIYKIWPQKVFWKITNNFFLKPPVHVGIWNFNIIYLYWVPWLFSRRNFEFSLFSLFFVVFVIAPHRKSLKWRFLSAKKKKSIFRREKSRGTL